MIRNKRQNFSEKEFLDLRKEKKHFSFFILKLKEKKEIFLFLFLGLMIIFPSLQINVLAPNSKSEFLVLSANENNEKDNEKERKALEEQLEEIEKQIEKYQKDILENQKKASSLQREIRILENKIAKFNLQIRATQIVLKRLNEDILSQERSIQEKENQINKEKEILSSLLQSLHEEEICSWLEIALRNSSLNEFFDNLNSISLVQENLRKNLEKLKQTKEELEEEKEKLLADKRETVALINLQNFQKKELLAKQAEKDKILKLTKGKESLYKKLLEKSQETAIQIRNRLYELQGIGKPIKFGDAVKFARFASQKTGVRPALILAVISQESKLGKNIGTCNRASDPPYKKWYKIMKPNRDQLPFQQIVSELKKAGHQLNIDDLPLSCPMKNRDGSYYGWGGAMGPAQFLPSTWLIYKDEIAQITGNNPPSPWNVQDAFVACALLLRDNGATNHSWRSEWRAAMKYFAGSVKWQFRFYGDSVMELARKYEQDIKKLED